METCPDCGCRVYKLGCVNCNEVAYIEEQRLRDNDYAICVRCGYSDGDCRCDEGSAEIEVGSDKNHD